MKKYYFITYQATSRDHDSHVAIWNEVIDESPMNFINLVEKTEEKGSDRWINFRVINTL